MVVDGAVHRPEDVVGELSFWTGTALGHPESRVFLSFSEEGSQGWVRLGVGLDDLHLTTERSSGEPVVRLLWGAQLMGAYTGELPGACQGERYAGGNGEGHLE